MQQNYLKIALATPPITVGAPEINLKEIKRIIKYANKQKAELVVFGQNALTGFSLGSMAGYRHVLDGAVEALDSLVDFSTTVATSFIVGLPVVSSGRIVDAAAVISNGDVCFVASEAVGEEAVEIFGDVLKFSPDVLIKDKTFNFNFSICFGEDFDRIKPRSQNLVADGADVIFNLSASPALIDSFDERKQKIACLSKRLTVGYVYVSTGQGESVAQNVYSGDKIASEAGMIISSDEGDSEELIYAELDIDAIRRKKLIQNRHSDKKIFDTKFEIKDLGAPITRKINRLPFVPQTAEFSRIFDILGRGIYTRMQESRSKKIILGLSGGLDSTIVLLVAHRMFVKYGLDLKDIVCVEMPASASSKRTKNNANKLIELLGVKGITIPIQDAVDAHLKAIGHFDQYDTVYENSQARERTKILLDLGNKLGALMLGTGDLSEVALGWSTFGGDQVAQYNPNSSLTKTLIRAMTRNYCLTAKNTDLARVLDDVLATPISPELLENQDTEKSIGPYEIHDFFLYNLIGKGLSVEKTFSLAVLAFCENKGKDAKSTGLDIAKNQSQDSDKLYGYAIRSVPLYYKKQEILSYLRIFVTRFFTNQFKRTASCDGIQLHPFDLTNMVIHSEFNAEQFLKQIDKLEKSL